MYRLDFTIFRAILHIAIIIYTLNRGHGIFVGACKQLYVEIEIITPTNPPVWKIQI